ncbi:probable multidrug resistance-associated protein lethal(2)03659 [Phymastichus coffea]|uniref:probable multidrug resistance-associated protein lethal(2)03659 n=1 Tax=Phymastichus coffea TaxID=108790 RepID=UPI00273BBD96|nr:probable multidrug resistance-associated protein lethal(2)03659 [Phymastichus coffea]
MNSRRSSSNPNPRDRANIFSLLTWTWTFPLFKTCWSKILGVEDLYDPVNKDRSYLLGDRLEKQWFTEQQRAKRKKRSPSFLWAIARTFASEIVLLGFIQIITELVLRLGTPLLLGRFLQYFKPASDMSYETAICYATGIVASNFITLTLKQQTMFIGCHLGGRIRIAACSVVYRKALRLSKIALGETAPGSIVNLVASDVNRFEIVFSLFHHIWSAPLLAVIIMIWLYSEIGWSAFIGMSIIFLVVPFQGYLGKLSSKYRLQTSLKTDERVRLMDEILSGVRIIKMYAWEKPFCALIEVARRLELKVVKKSSYIRGIYMTFFIFTTRMALYVTLVTMLLRGQELNMEKVFVYMSYFNLISLTLSSMFVRSMAEITECKVAINRIQYFLMYDEFQTNIVDNENILIPNVIHDDSWAIKLEHVTAKWDLYLSQTIFDDVDLKIEKGKLYIIIGKVAAGKSSFMSTILGELVLSQGSVEVKGSVSFADQDSWVFGASVRQNILFGQEFDRRRYTRVVKVCALQKDFQQFPYGDKTIVGERGNSLSGGQRARINLARAVYRQADIYLLDDPLSAVDAHVGKKLFQECFQKYLSGKTRILATHQLQYLKSADAILLLDRGKLYQYSNYHELLHAYPEYNFLMTESKDKQAIEETDRIRKTSITSTRVNQGRRISDVRQKQFIISAQNRRMSEINQKLCIFPQDQSVSETNRKLSIISIQSIISDSGLEFDEDDDDEFGQDIFFEDTSRATVKGSHFGNYIKSGASNIVAFWILILYLGTQTFVSLNDYFIPVLVDAEEYRNHYNKLYGNSSLLITKNNSEKFLKEKDILSRDYYIYIYTALVTSIFLVGITRSIVFYNMCLRASQHIHDLAFGALIRAKMNFFNTNSSGRILNRFSKDLGAIDELLPRAILDSVQSILTMVGTVTVTCTVNLWFLLPVLLIGIVFYFIRWIYLKTSKKIKRLEGMTRSPMFTHLSATLNGITTIRAYQAESMLKKEFDKLQDMHSSSWYMFIATSIAFGFSLDVCCFIFTGVVTFTFLLLKEHFTGGTVGLAITQVMSLTGLLQWGIRQSAEVTNQLMSVERVLEYAQLTCESNIRNKGSLKSKKTQKREHREENLLVEPPEKWPAMGQVEFKNVSMRYLDEDPPILKNLTLIIRPTEKVGVVGRTGAGKSSLISALFRLVEIEGVIEIDGIDTGTIALEDLRKSISIIPQDPVLFSGTLRRNLDPFNELSDKRLYEVLEEVELKPSENGLDHKVLDRGSNYSTGQRQLICLARAILRNNRILMLDEATANVDPYTDALIQRTIRSKFAACTVLTVAHRLNTIIDSDKVLMLDKGRLVEYNHPYLLLQNQNSPFSLLVKETGQTMYEQLLYIARDSYISKYVNT